MADDFLQKKKENGAILDLSKSACETKEDLRKLLDKVPDFKIRPVKYRTEDIKIRDKKEYKFKTSKKDFKVLKETYNFPEPIPVEMKTVKLEDLVTIPIDWRMLTMLRPKLKLDEDYYSRCEKHNTGGFFKKFIFTANVISTFYIQYIYLHLVYIF